ncbi:hypothetical protein [Kocuria sp.]|uniref:hypothetical protein n=1 Tax=Kocuria sp. TaxID=1871328 RepID=UPI0026E0F499|nr:hypothetical protein [Kocuria sp.]MDO5617635.1 hypothetical protein [Kocuria sp.]
MTVEPRWRIPTPLPHTASADALWMVDAVTGLSSGELLTLAHDGVLVPVLGPVHYAKGSAITRQVKAAAIRAVVPQGVWHRSVLHRASAAWFHSCAPAPQVVDFITLRQDRASTRPAPPSAPVRWVTRQLLHQPMDVDHFYGLAVTTPLRTAVDVACWEHPDAVEILTVLMGAPHLRVQPQAVVEVIRARPRLPHRDRGVANVRKAARRLDLPVPAGRLSAGTR